MNIQNQQAVIEQTDCPICNKPLRGGGQFKDAAGKLFHWDCHVKFAPQRMKRSAWRMRQDILEKNYAEMREAIAAREKYQREAEQIKDRLRSQVRRDVVDEFRKLPFFQRLRILFNPFATKRKLMISAFLGVRFPHSALFLPPKITPRCGHPFPPAATICPHCGLSADVASAAAPIAGFDPAARTLHGYSAIRSHDFYYVGVPIKTTFALSLESFAEIYILMKQKFTFVGLWDQHQGFGVSCVTETQ